VATIAWFDASLNLLIELIPHLFTSLFLLIVSQIHVVLQALLNIKVLNEDLKNNTQRFQQVPSTLQHFFNAFVSESIKTEESRVAS